METSRKKILIVEDQWEFFAIQRTYLEHHGYEVLRAVDGATAVEIAGRSMPDLVLMDCALPGIDGIQATEQLMRDPRTRDIPVVLLTAMSYGAVGRRAREAGCRGFLRKPCEPRRMLEEVRHWAPQPVEDRGSDPAEAVR